MIFNFGSKYFYFEKQGKNSNQGNKLACKVEFSLQKFIIQILHENE